MNKTNMVDKLQKIKKANDDFEYLKGEYEHNKLWGSCPDGDVKFESLVDWLSKDDVRYMIEHIIATIDITNSI